MSRYWMPMYWADFKSDTEHLGALETGAYLMLIGHYWTTGGLPDDDRKLARIARMTPDEWFDCKHTIYEFFQPGWKHKRIDAELAKNSELSDRRSAAANKRWQCKSNASADASAYANDMRSQSQSQLDTIVSNNTRDPSPLEVLSECLTEQTAKDVIEHRKKLRKPMTARAARELAKSFISYGNAEVAAAAMIERGWTGFKPEWMETTRNRTGPPSYQNGKTGGWAMLSMKLKELENETEDCSNNAPVLELSDYGRAVS